MHEICRVTGKPCLIGCHDRGSGLPYYCFIDSGTSIMAYGNAGKKIEDLDQNELNRFLGPDTLVTGRVLSEAQHEEYKKAFLDMLEAKLATPQES